MPKQTPTPHKTETQIDQLRQKLIELNKMRDAAIFEKGQAARENNDLRENFAYDYWCQQEDNYTTRIHELIKEIDLLARQGRGVQKISDRSPANKNKKQLTRDDHKKQLFEEVTKKRWL